MNSLFIVMGVVSIFIHLVGIIGTVAIAAEKNRNVLHWTLAAIFLSPVVFIIILLAPYSKKKFPSAGIISS